jgi:hypothetical protein
MRAGCYYYETGWWQLRRREEQRRTLCREAAIKGGDDAAMVRNEAKGAIRVVVMEVELKAEAGVVEEQQQCSAVQ